MRPIAESPTATEGLRENKQLNGTNYVTWRIDVMDMLLKGKVADFVTHKNYLKKIK
jgi:hypothetical protein